MQRRKFLQSLSIAMSLAVAGLRDVMAFSRPKTDFRHGVASGDPTDRSVIIWTRVTTAVAVDVEVAWQVARDEAMLDVVADGVFTTGASRDFTVKVDVTGLDAGNWYFYRFTCNGQESQTGRTRTLPQVASGVAKFAVVSCSNYPAGFFNVYRDIALRDDLDLVLHLGDYIYEYGLGQYGTENASALGRVPEPQGEILTISDYRARHAQYKADTDSRAMHARLPLVAIWDDHEFANDSWKDGAENHNDDEGSWVARRDAALQAYFEWMPVRGEPQGGKTRIFREFRWGKLASILMLDTRLFGRDMQPNVGNDVTPQSVGQALQDATRRMLGAEQEAWLKDRLRKSHDTTWQLIGQQVMVATMGPPDLEPLIDRNAPSYFNAEQMDMVIASSKSHRPQILDVWDGYPAAKADFLQVLGALASNPVVLSGDLHTAMAANLVLASTDGPVAVEMMTTSVTSPTLSGYFPSREPNGVRDGILQQNPDLRFLDIEDHGWLCVTLTAEECTGEWNLLNTVHSRDFESRLAKKLSVKAGAVGKGLH